METSSMEIMRDIQKKYIKKLITKVIKENGYTFPKFKELIFSCLEDKGAIIIEKPLSIEPQQPPPEPQEDDEPNVFDEYGVEEEDIDYEQYLEPQQFRQGIKQWEQMSIGRGTTIEGGGENIDRMKTIMKYTDVKTIIEQALQNGIVKIKEVGENLRLNDNIINTATNIWRQIISKISNQNTGKQIKREWIVFSFLYTTNELNDLDYDISRIFSEFQINPSKMKNYTAWVSQNKDILPQKEIKNIIFCNIELTPQNKKELYNYVKEIEDRDLLTNNISPRNNIRAKTSLMYWYLKDKIGTRVTKKRIEEACNSTVSNEFYQAIKNKL